jgi:hypothetical protein
MGGHGMATVTIGFDIESLKAEVIRKLGEQSCRPIELLTSLAGSYPDDRIKEAVLRLLQEGRIELTPDRHLQVSQDAS